MITYLAQNHINIFYIIETNPKSPIWSNWLYDTHGIDNIYFRSHGFTGIYISADLFRVDMYDETGSLLFQITRPVPKNEKL